MPQSIARKSNQFVVDLGTAKVPDKIADRLDKAIRRAALDVLADLDLDRGEKLDFHLPRDWRGLVANVADHALFR